MLAATVILLTYHAGAVQAQPPAPQARVPESWDAFSLPPESNEAPQALRRSEIEAYLHKERAALSQQQRSLASAARAREGIAALRPTRPSNPRMQSYYSPRRIIYVPYFVD